MSRRLQDQFWELDLTPTEQVVAQRLAWHANDDDGRCWPSIGLLATKTGLSDRAVQKAIKSLEQRGHLTRQERCGLGTIYTIHPTGKPVPGPDDVALGASTPEQNSPVVDAERADTPEPCSPRTAFTPEPRSPRTSFTPERGSRTPERGSPKQVKNREDDDGGARHALAHIAGRRGTRMVPDWQPAQDLPAPIANATAGWPPGRLADELEAFRDFWLAEAGKGASKLDWDRTWWNRLRALVSRERDREDRHGRRSHHRHRRDDDGLNNPMAAAAARQLAASHG